MITSLRVVRAGRRPGPLIRSAEEAYRVLCPLARGLDREHFWRLDLDSRRRLLGCELVSMGSLDASIVHPRLCAAAHKRGYVASAVMLCSTATQTKPALPDAT